MLVYRLPGLSAIAVCCKLFLTFFQRVFIYTFKPRQCHLGAHSAKYHHSLLVIGCLNRPNRCQSLDANGVIYANWSGGSPLFGSRPQSFGSILLAFFLLLQVAFVSVFPVLYLFYACLQFLVGHQTTFAHSLLVVCFRCLCLAFSI